MNYSKHNEVQRKANPMASALVYQHMSSHYRRILNAKPSVDSSPPKSFKPRAIRLSSHCTYSTSGSLCSSQESLPHCFFSNSQFNNEISCKKRSPSVSCGMEWVPTRENRALLEKGDNHRSHGRNNSSTRTGRPRVPGDIMERHKDEFEAFGSQFWPRILKTEAESKLRRMRVYHPPKRKVPFSKAEWENNKSDDEGLKCKCRDICKCSQDSSKPECKEQSQTSSRDSAYNGGISSTPESRSPTPLQRKQHANCSLGNLRPNTSHIGTQTDSWNSPNLKHGQKREVGDGVAYTKLIHDITQEVVERGQYTDKSLARIIAKHITANIQTLDMDRMLKEVAILKKELGISKNNEEFEESSIDDPLVDSADGTKSYVESSHHESWTSVYSHLDKISSKAADSARNGKPPGDLNATYIVSNSQEALADRFWGDDEDSDSSKESTIKEMIRRPSKEKRSTKSSETSSYVETADDISFASGT